MFYSGIDPYTMKKVYVPKTKEEKAEQRALLQYFRPENRQAVIAALTKAGRKDLIGSKPECLVAPISTKQKTFKSKVPAQVTKKHGKRMKR